MPLSLNEATAIIKREIPIGEIQAVVEYKGLYLFQVFTDRALEEDMDPFYSVNMETGEFRDFSVFDDGNINEITALFLEVKKQN